MSHNLKFKSFKIDQFTEEDGGLTIEGWGAKYGNIDAVRDVMKPGSCTKTLMERKDRIAFCLQHDIYNPIGKIKLIEDRPEGLWLSVRISESEKAIQTKVKEGILVEMSIGYREINTTKGTQDGQDVNFLNEVMLYEVSLVTIAANPLAIITGMKSDEQANFIDDEFERLIAIERNPSKKFDLMKLKAQIQALEIKEPEMINTTPPINEPLMSKADILNCLS